MAQKNYYTLIASLPKLEHFERAERLPINRVRLDQRLTLLDPDQASQLSRAEVLLEWPHQSLSTPEQQVAAVYRRNPDLFSNKELREFVHYRFELRIVMAALRYRRQLSNTVEHVIDGNVIDSNISHNNIFENKLFDKKVGQQVGPRLAWIIQHWDEPLFRLEGLYPWIRHAHKYLDNSDALSLEKLLMNVIWQRAAYLREQYLFGFESVFAYVFQWDIMHRWLSYKTDAATKRFQTMIEEINRGVI